MVQNSDTNREYIVFKVKYEIPEIYQKDCAKKKKKKKKRKLKTYQNFENQSLKWFQPVTTLSVFF